MPVVPCAVEKREGGEKEVCPVMEVWPRDAGKWTEEERGTVPESPNCPGPGGICEDKGIPPFSSNTC